MLSEYNLVDGGNSHLITDLYMESCCFMQPSILWLLN